MGSVALVLFVVVEVGLFSAMVRCYWLAARYRDVRNTSLECANAYWALAAAHWSGSPEAVKIAEDRIELAVRAKRVAVARLPRKVRKEFES